MLLSLANLASPNFRTICRDFCPGCPFRPPHFQDCFLNACSVQACVIVGNARIDPDGHATFGTPHRWKIEHMDNINHDFLHPCSMSSTLRWIHSFATCKKELLRKHQHTWRTKVMSDQGLQFKCIANALIRRFIKPNDRKRWPGCLTNVAVTCRPS